MSFVVLDLPHRVRAILIVALGLYVVQDAHAVPLGVRVALKGELGRLLLKSEFLHKVLIFELLQHVLKHTLF